MDPVTASVLMVASTGLSAYGAYASGKAQQAAAEYNADLNRQQAEVAREDAAENAKRREKDQQRALSRMRAQYGAQGLSEQGVVGDVLGDVAGQFELELADMFTAADRRATAYENSAQLYDYEGGVAATSGLISGLSAIGQGGANLGFKLQDRNNQGA